MFFNSATASEVPRHRTDPPLYRQQQDWPPTAPVRIDLLRDGQDRCRRLSFGSRSTLQ